MNSEGSEARIHAVVSYDDPGVFLTSPQIPGFVAAYDSEEQLMEHRIHDLGLAAHEVGIEKPFRVIGHVQHFGVAGGRSYAIRYCPDRDDSADLRRTGAALISLLEDGAFADWATDDAEVLTFLCLAEADTVGWAVEQLDLRGDLVHLAARVGASGIFVTTFGSGAIAEEWEHEDREWSPEMTIGDLVNKHMAREVNQIAGQPVRIPVS